MLVTVAFADGCASWWVPSWAKNEKGVRTQKQVWREITEIVEGAAPGVMDEIRMMWSIRQVVD